MVKSKNFSYINFKCLPHTKLNVFRDMEEAKWYCVDHGIIQRRHKWIHLLILPIKIVYLAAKIRQAEASAMCYERLLWLVDGARCQNRLRIHCVDVPASMHVHLLSPKTYITQNSLIKYRLSCSKKSPYFRHFEKKIQHFLSLVYFQFIQGT